MPFCRMGVNAARVDEIIVVRHIFDHANRLRSYEILTDIFMG